MSAKRVFGFLLMRPAWSSRNLTSLALVALFFGVYVAAGGKVSSVPKVKQGSSFGTMSTDEDKITGDVESVTREEESAADVAARRSEQRRGVLSLGTEEDLSLKPRRIEERPLHKSEESARAAEAPSAANQPADDLSDIEARLNIRSKGGK